MLLVLSLSHSATRYFFLAAVSCVQMLKHDEVTEVCGQSNADTKYVTYSSNII